MSQTMNQNVRISVAEDDDHIGLLDLAVTLAENIKLLVLGPLMLGGLALGLSFFITPTFTATTKFLPPQQQQGVAAAMMQGLGALGGLAGAAAGIKNPADQYIAFLKSRSVQESLVKRFTLRERYEVDLIEDAIAILNSKIQVSSGKDGVVVLTIDDVNPTFAAQLANAYLEELGYLLDRLALTEAQHRRQFFEKQLQQTKVRLADAQKRLQGSGINEGALRAEPKAAAEAYATLKAKFASAQITLRSMHTYLTEEAPEFKLAQSNLSSLQSELAKTEAENDNAAAGNYIATYREFKYQEALFELFAKQYELARLDEAREGAVIQILDVAVPPERKSKPNKAQIAILVTLATGFVLVLFIFSRKALQRALRNPVIAGKIKNKSVFKEGLVVED